MSIGHFPRLLFVREHFRKLRSRVCSIMFLLTIFNKHMILFYLGSFPFIFLITWLSRDSNFEGGNTAELMLRIPLIIRFSSRDFATQNNLVNKWLFSHFESEPSVSCWDDSLLCPGLVFFWCMKTCYSISRDVPFRIWSFDECQSLVCPITWCL